MRAAKPRQSNVVVNFIIIIIIITCVCGGGGGEEFIVPSGADTTVSAVTIPLPSLDFPYRLGMKKRLAPSDLKR